MMFRSRALHMGGHALLGLVVTVVLALVFGWVVMVAWNAVMPALFAVPVVTFWQAAALLVLARILTGRLTHGHHCRSHHGRHRFKGRFRCSPSRDSAALYSAWWDEEGEAAFQAYAARQLGEKDQG